MDYLYRCNFDVLLLIVFLTFCSSLVVGTRSPFELLNGLSKLRVPREILEFFFGWVDAQDYPKIPEAKGSIKAIQSEAFFIPLFELYLIYGGIFRLNFGPKVVFIFSSDC